MRTSVKIRERKLLVGEEQSSREEDNENVPQQLIGRIDQLNGRHNPHESIEHGPGLEKLVLPKIRADAYRGCGEHTLPSSW